MHACGLAKLVRRNLTHMHPCCSHCTGVIPIVLDVPVPVWPANHLQYVRGAQNWGQRELTLEGLVVIICVNCIYADYMGFPGAK